MANVLSVIFMDSKTLYAEVGRRAASRRRQIGRTQAEIAQAMGLSRASIANIEVGRQSLLLHQTYHLATALGLTTLEELLPALPAAKIPVAASKVALTGSRLNQKQRSEVDAFISNVEPRTKKRGRI